MKAQTLSLNGSKNDDIELPDVFSTPFRKELIHKAYVHLNSHKFQRQGRHPTAGEDVSADTNNPPTGRGISRVARMRGGGGGRQGQGGEVASVRGGRQAHPPKSEKVIYKKLNKKEKKLALCSAIAATKSKSLIESRGHKIKDIESFPIIISDDVESISNAKAASKLFNDLKLTQDIDRLYSRKARSGKSALRGRKTKIGKSVLFVTKKPQKLAKACGSFPGIDVIDVNELSVLDLSPGSAPIRLTVFSKNAINEIAKIKSPHLELMVKIK